MKERGAILCGGGTEENRESMKKKLIIFMWLFVFHLASRRDDLRWSEARFALITGPVVTRLESNRKLCRLIGVAQHA